MVHRDERHQRRHEYRETFHREPGENGRRKAAPRPAAAGGDPASAWRPAAIPDQAGRTFVVTGANGGLGRVVTQVLAERGATVVMACRDTERARTVAAGVAGDVRVDQLDLANLKSIRDFADRQDRVDVLVNNAGLMNVPFSRTADGFETQFGVNHLGHFALTGLLLDRIEDRVVTLSSTAHRQAPRFWLGDLNYRYRRYRRWPAYAQSKLANLMFARELQRRLTNAGATQRSYAVHPGLSAGTGLFTQTDSALDRFIRWRSGLLGHPPAAAAQSMLFAATVGCANPWCFWGPTKHFQTCGPVGRVSSSRASRCWQAWRELWEASAQLTGVAYRC